jgi:hypothetical protein
MNSETSIQNNNPNNVINSLDNKIKKEGKLMLKAGVSIIDITPPTGIELGGYPHFLRHNEKGSLYILINKEDNTDKYQFHFETKQYMDKNDNVINWSYEKIIIPYISTLDGEMHRYYIDFFCVIKCGNTNKKFLT